MKVVAFNGSPRGGGNTEHLIKEVFQVLEEHDIETELIQLKGKKINGCIACGKCREVQDGTCKAGNDFLNECIAKMVEADGIILGSPVYFADITTEMKALIDVSGYVTRGNGHQLAKKVGAGVIAVRRAGALPAFNTINNFFLINQMMVPGNIYWNMGYGKKEGDVMEDEEGLNIMRNLGENMAWLMKKVVDKPKKKTSVKKKSVEIKEGPQQTSLF